MSSYIHLAKNEMKKKCCDKGYVNKRCKFNKCKRCCIRDNKGDCSVHKIGKFSSNKKYDNIDKIDPNEKKNNKFETNVKKYEEIDAKNDDNIEKGNSTKKYNNIKNSDFSTNKTEKLKSIIKFEDFLEKIKVDINNVMSIMQTTDLDSRNGLNEAGFKMIIISTIMKYIGMYDVVLFSEYPVAKEVLKIKKYKNASDKYLDPIGGSIKTNKFIDIYIETENEIVIIEVKYVRLQWIKGIEPSTDIPRIKLSSLKDVVRKLTDDQLLDKEEYSGVKMKKNLNDTGKNQLSDYSKLILAELEGEEKSITTYVFYGISDRCIVKRFDNSK